MSVHKLEYCVCRGSEPGIRVGWRDLGRLVGRQAFQVSWRTGCMWKLVRFTVCAQLKREAGVLKNAMPLFTVVK